MEGDWKVERIKDRRKQGWEKNEDEKKKKNREEDGMRKRKEKDDGRTKEYKGA